MYVRLPILDKHLTIPYSSFGELSVPRLITMRDMLDFRPTKLWAMPMMKRLHSLAKPSPQSKDYNIVTYQLCYEVTLLWLHAVILTAKEVSGEL